MSSFIIGTAGHIDHGKTSLVEALTGVHLDSAPEERQRGITISLGFTPLSLPSGRQAALIDVPGHEKFVRTMISGASGIDAVLLCISAVESVMPQTKEHLEILNLLHIQHGIIAITMCDLSDPELLEMVQLEIEELTEGTFLEGAPIVHTSAGPEKTGIDQLLSIIDNLPSMEKKVDGPFRLPVDRVFTQKGFGTVITGTSRNGQLSEGDDVELIPGNVTCRVRNLQVHGEKTSLVGPNERVAINLSGINHNQINRGATLIKKDSIPQSSIVDVAYHHLSTAPSISNGTRLRLLAGSDEVLAKIEILDSEELTPGESFYVQLRLQRPSVFLPNDRFILRRESPLETLGGGVILDPFSEKIKRKHRDRQIPFLKRLHRGDSSAFLERRGASGLSSAVSKIVGATGESLGERVYAGSVLLAWQQQILESLLAWHQQHPLRIGILSRELHNVSLPFLPDKQLDILVKQLMVREKISASGQFLRHHTFCVALHPEQERTVQEGRQRLLDSGWEGINRAEIPEFNRDLLQYLIDSEQVIRIQTQILHPKMIENLIECLRSFFATQEEMTTSDFKDITKLSRKYLIPLLEWCDQQGITVRKGNSRFFRK